MVFRIFDLSRLNSFGFVFIFCYFTSFRRASPLARDHDNHLTMTITLMLYFFLTFSIV